MKKYLLLGFMLMLAFVYNESWAQERTVSGKVTSAEDGATLPGVNVVLKGTTTGTVTDIDGNYKLSVPQNGGILVFSFIGLASQEIEIGSRAVIDLQMASDIKQLSEVVVVGYGEQDARALTGSVVKVNSESIEKIPIADISRTLQGNVAGLQSSGGSGSPGAATEVRIRGIGSATASAEPLYIVDGIPIQTADLSNNTATANPLAQLNPNDIADVTVLKDASSSAIYGSRGSNGVIIITTKQGKAGKSKISVRAQYGFSDQAYQKYERLNRDEYIELKREAVANAGGDPDAVVFDEGNTDWYDVIFRTGKTKSYDASVSGGDSKTRFYVSGSYFDQDGITIATGFERFSARMNIDHSATDDLTIGLNIAPSYSKQDNTTQGSTFNSLVLQSMLLSPTAPVYNEDGTYFTDFPGLLGGGGYNPLAITELDRRDNDVARVLGKMYASYNFFEGLSFRTDLSLDYYQGTEQVYQNSQIGDGRSVGGRSQIDTERNIIWQTTNNLTYNKTIADVHNLSVSAVFESLERTNLESTARSEGFANDVLINPVNGANPIVASGTETSSSLISYLGIVRYDYNGRYYLSGSFRRDGSSRFGKDVKYGNFSSIGLSWLISEENFMRNIGAFNTLKIRGGYGQTGNEAIGDFQSQGLFTGGTYNSQSSFNPTQIANPELTWEKGTQLNIGLDFGLFNNRISGTIERYIKKTDALLFDVPVSRLTGFNSVLTNAAALENRGWEFTINSQNIQTPDFSWTTSFNIAFNKNETIDIGGGQTEFITGTKKRTIGHDWSEYYLAIYAGVNPADGRPLWYDTLGNLTDQYSAALKVLTGKNSTPDFFGGLTNRVSYKGIDLSFLFTFSYGAYIYDNFAFVYASNGAFNENQKKTQLDRWQKPGDVAQNPQRIDGQDLRGSAVDTGDLQDGSYIRLRNVTLGYTIPSTITSKINLASVRLYVMGTNLATFSKFNGLDPEQLVTGVDSFLYPNPRTLSFGLDIGF